MKDFIFLLNGRCSLSQVSAVGGHTTGGQSQPHFKEMAPSYLRRPEVRELGRSRGADAASSPPPKPLHLPLSLCGAPQRVPSVPAPGGVAGVPRAGRGHAGGPRGAVTSRRSSPPPLLLTLGGTRRSLPFPVAPGGGGPGAAGPLRATRHHI